MEKLYKQRSRVVKMNRLKECKCLMRHPYNDRLFSQVVRHLLSFFIAKNLGKTHVHWDFEDKEIRKKFEMIFDGALVDKRDTFANCVKRKVMSKPDQNWSKIFGINEIFSVKNLEKLKRAYKLTKHTQTFNPKHINVAVHIRRGDISNATYCGRYTYMDFFIDRIKTVRLILKSCDVHVYSDSRVNVGLANVIYHINEDILCSIHDMIRADVLIISIGSNVDHFACLLNEGIKHLDKRKLKYCFNNKYNIYWGKLRNITVEIKEFANKLSRYKAKH